MIQAEESEFHQEYVSSSSDSESLSDEENLEPYRSRARSIVREGGRVPQTADGGDLGGDEGWTRNFVSPNTDLNFNEDGKGPVNIPGSITEESEPTDFLSLFLDVLSSKI